MGSEQGTAAASGSAPRATGVSGPVFRASAPVRLDFAGAWTDVAPFAERERGVVVNAAIELRARAEVEPLVVLVAPFAPHLAEELWSRLGHEPSIFDAANWPTYDPAKATLDTVEFVVQVNGKVRARIAMPRGITQEDAQAAALAEENVRRFVDGAQVRKVVFVPDRLLNLVVG